MAVLAILTSKKITMKKNALIPMVAFMILLLNANLLFSQRIYKSEEDSIEAIKAISTYKEYVLKKYYDDALTPWRKVYENWPQASKSIYIDGVKIYRHKIEQAKDEALKDKYVDSLMMVYDKRIEYFGNDKEYPTGYIVGMKGIDLLRYKKNNVDEIYKYLSQSVSLQKEQTEPAVVTTFMQVSSRLYQTNSQKAEQVAENFLTSMDILSNQREIALKKVSVPQYYQYLADLDSLENILVQYELDKNKFKFEIRESEKAISDLKKKRSTEFNLDQCEKAIRNIENIFSNSGAASCAILIEIFTPKLDANKENIEFLKKLTKLLDKNNCVDSELFSTSSEQLYKLEPSALAAYNIAKLYVKKGTNEDFQKATEYYENAIKDELDDLAKAKYYYELAYVNIKLEQYQKARTYADEAIKRNRSWGKPYLIIAMAYASSAKSCGQNELEKKSVYWAAVDKCKKALTVDETIAEQAKQLIQTYSGYFPNNEDAFFFGYTDGQPYKVGCWIQEMTTVRTIKK